MASVHKKEGVSRWGNYSELGRLLVEYIWMNGNPTNEDFANSIGIDSTTFSKIINGKRWLYGPEIWVRLTQVLIEGKNGRRAIANETELNKFFYKVTHVPGTPLNSAKVEYIRRRLRELGVTINNGNSAI